MLTHAGILVIIRTTIDIGLPISLVCNIASGRMCTCTEQHKRWNSDSDPTLDAPKHELSGPDYKVILAPVLNT